MRKRIDHWCSVVPEKFQPSVPPFSGKLGKPRQASFPTGTVGPQVRIFLSPLNTNDGFYFSHIPTHTKSSDPYVSSLLEKSVPHRWLCEISVTNTR